MCAKLLNGKFCLFFATINLAWITLLLWCMVFFLVLETRSCLHHWFCHRWTLVSRIKSQHYRSFAPVMNIAAFVIALISKRPVTLPPSLFIPNLTTAILHATVVQNLSDSDYASYPIVAVHWLKSSSYTAGLRRVYIALRSPEIGYTWYLFLQKFCQSCTQSMKCL